jgi:hypothetical protein
MTYRFCRQHTYPQSSPLRNDCSCYWWSSYTCSSTQSFSLPTNGWVWVRCLTLLCIPYHSTDHIRNPSRKRGETFSAIASSVFQILSTIPIARKRSVSYRNGCWRGFNLPSASISLFQCMMGRVTVAKGHHSSCSSFNYWFSFCMDPA